MERERSRRRNSTAGASLRASRKDEVDEDAKSTGSMHTLKSRSFIRDEGDSTLVTVVELCSDTLVDRFLEFQPLSVIIRAYEGPDQPAAIVGAISTTTSNVVAPERATQVVLPEFQLLFYEDTEFFHVMDRTVTLILCSCSSPGQRYVELLRGLLESILRVHCVSIPSMSSIVKYGYAVAVNLTAFVSAKKAATTPQPPQPVWASQRSSLSGEHPSLALTFPTTAPTVSGQSRETYSKSSAWALVDELCLQFHRGASPFELSAMLEHVRAAVTFMKLPRSLGVVLESFLGVVQPLLELLWRSSSIPALREDIAQVVQLVVEKILADDIQFLFFLKFGDVCLDVLVSMMRDRDMVGWGPATRSAVVVCFALINPMQAVKYFRTKLLLAASDLVVVVDVLALCGASAFRGTGVFHQHGGGTSASDRLQSSLVGLKTHFLQAQQQSHPLLSPPLAFREPLSASHFTVCRAKLRVVWLAFPSFFEIVEALLNDVMEPISTSAVGETHGKMLVALNHVSMLVTISLRTLLFLEENELESVISHCAPSLSTFFRRAPSWFAFVDAGLHSMTLSQAILFAVAVAIVRGRYPNRLPHIQHEWLTRVSLGCGAVGYRSVVMELHFVFDVATAKYPSWTDVHHAHHALVRAVFVELASICERILQSAPSPSTLLSSWESCLALVRGYLAVIQDPGLLSPRLNLSRTLLHAGIREVGVDVGWSNFGAGSVGWSSAARLPALPHASVEWDDLSGFRELRRLWRRSATIVAKHLDSESLGMFAVVMEYLLPALESDRIARRWNSLSAQLFQVAQFLVEQRAPQALTGTVMEAAVALSSTSTAGMDVASLVTLSQRYCAEAFERLNATMTWRLAVPLRTEQHVLEENDRGSMDRYRAQSSDTRDVAANSAVSVDADENQSPVVILVARKKKRSVNVLHRFAGL